MAQTGAEVIKFLSNLINMSETQRNATLNRMQKNVKKAPVKKKNKKVPKDASTR